MDSFPPPIDVLERIGFGVLLQVFPVPFVTSTADLDHWLAREWEHVQDAVEKSGGISGEIDRVESSEAFSQSWSPPALPCVLRGRGRMVVSKDDGLGVRQASTCVQGMERALFEAFAKAHPEDGLLLLRRYVPNSPGSSLVAALVLNPLGNIYYQASGVLFSNSLPIRRNAKGEIVYFWTRLSGLEQVMTELIGSGSLSVEWSRYAASWRKAWLEKTWAQNAGANKSGPKSRL